jgi:hypothetical protein
MSVLVHKLIGAAGMLSLVVFAAGASAATPGYPAGRPYYGSSHRHAHVYRTYAPANVTESRQSFSHEPAAAASDAKADNQAAPQASQEKAQSEHVAAAPQTTTRQSFSYEPATVRSSGRHSRHRDAWLLQKADSQRIEL